MKIQIELPKGFLDQETRCDYRISSDMKKVWAVQLDELNEFIKVCDRHDLRWFAIGGTLLGAMRHKGYIPWDDDIDVAMPRQDYDKFIKIAQSEMPDYLFVQNSKTDPAYVDSFIKIRNDTTAVFTESAITNGYRYNQGLSIDIFPLDGCPDQEPEITKLVTKLKKIQMLWACASRHKNISFRSRLKSMFLRAICYPLWMHGIREDICRQIGLVRCKCCTIALAEFGSNPRFRWSYSCFKGYDIVPFEFLQVRVPKGWREILQISYGDWHKFVKDASMHSGHKAPLVYMDVGWKVMIKRVMGH